MKCRNCSHCKCQQPQPRISAPKPRCATKLLSDEQVNNLMSNVESDSVQRLIALLMVDAGLRKGEVERLEWSAVDIPNGVLRVSEAKAPQPRFVPIDQPITAALI